MMNLRAENGLLNAVGTYFHHATPGLGPDLETDQCPEWGAKQKQVAARTMADITAFAGLAFADFAKVEVPETLTHLTAWRAKVAARPSIAA